MTAAGVLRGREAVLARLLQRGFFAPSVAPGEHLQVTDLALLRDAVQHQSQQALQLTRECRLPIPERRST